VRPMTNARPSLVRVQTLLCALLAVVLTIFPAAASSATTAQGTPALAAAGPPAIPAKAALLADAASGAVLWQRNAHRPVLVASTTKMLTALVAEESFLPTERLVVPDAAERVDGTRFGFKRGMRIARDTLLATLLLTSANDAAEVLARNYRNGGRGGFLAAMQARCAQLGCTDSTWRDPAGLDAPGHKASAADLAIVARALLARPLLANLVGRQHLAIRWNGRSQVLTNHNKLVRFDTAKGMIGVKTGYTSKSGHTLVAAQQRHGRTLIAVVLGSKSYYDDARKLLAWGFGVPVPAGAELLGISSRAVEPPAAPPPVAAAPAPRADSAAPAAAAAAAGPSARQARPWWREGSLPIVAAGTGTLAVMGAALLIWRGRRRRRVFRLYI
jgi:serine-type D-Ala-D-Ala carboxypeptidase (penicillin-binding protein 5/6)